MHLSIHTEDNKMYYNTFLFYKKLERLHTLNPKTPHVLYLLWSMSFIGIVKALNYGNTFGAPVNTHKRQQNIV
jgi:hypothetical protein